LRLANRRAVRDVREARAEIRERRHGGAPNVPIPRVLQSIAMCESHGNPRAISPCRDPLPHRWPRPLARLRSLSAGA
jgi:hypothetical protein